MFTHVAFQIYLERLHKGTFSGSFFEFSPHYFEGMYGFGGNFAWMGLHLWYLELLFILSLICLPIFIWFKRTSIGKRVLQGMGDLLVNPAAVLLLALPAIYLILNLDEATWGNQSMGGWSVVIYPLFYIAGFVILSNERLQKYIVRVRWIHLGMGLIFSTAYLFGEFQTAYPTDLFPLADAVVKVLDCFVVWSCLLAVLGFGMMHLNFTNPFLKYGSHLGTWRYMLERYFWRPGRSVDLIVTPFFGRGLADGDRMELGRLLHSSSRLQRIGRRCWASISATAPPRSNS